MLPFWVVLFWAAPRPRLPELLQESVSPGSVRDARLGVPARVPLRTPSSAARPWSAPSRRGGWPRPVPVVDVADAPPPLLGKTRLSFAGKREPRESKKHASDKQPFPSQRFLVCEGILVFHACIFFGRVDSVDSPISLPSASLSLDVCVRTCEVCA